MQNTVAVGAVLRLMGLDFAGLESVLKTTFAKKPQVVAANVDAARAGFDYAAQNFPPLARQLAPTATKWALVTGNEMLSMGGGGGRLQILLRLPDESGFRRPALDGRPRQGAGHLRPPGRGRDFRHQHGHRRQPRRRPRHVRHLRRRLRA